MTFIPNGQGGVVQHPILTTSQRDEIDKVQGMQVRTQAAIITASMFRTNRPLPSTWLRWAQMVEGYIRGEVPADRPAPPLRTRA
jgi:hypothetical protein